MECSYCGAELICEDYYGYTKHAEHYWEYPQSWIEKEGDIYRCPNHEGFQSKEDVLEYLGREDKLEEYLKDCGYSSWKEVVCESSTHHVSGSFYTDKNDNLHEGYPC